MSKVVSQNLYINKSAKMLSTNCLSVTNFVKSLCSLNQNLSLQCFFSTYEVFTACECN